METKEHVMGLFIVVVTSLGLFRSCHDTKSQADAFGICMVTHGDSSRSNTFVNLGATSWCVLTAF